MRPRRLGSLALALCLAACANRSADLPAVDLEAPGWQVWTGQVSWQRPGADPIAGELLAALGDEDQVVVNLSKAALPLFTAQAAPSGWRIDFVEDGGQHRGRGNPPSRFVWFRLPALLADATLELDGWSVSRPAADELMLESRRSDERIRLILDPR